MRQKSLASYQTQLSDVAKGITRVPLPLARLTEEDIIKLDEVIEHGSLTHVQVRKESSDADRLSDLERLEELGKNLEKQLDLRNSSNSDSGSGNEYPVVDVLNDTAFFHEVLDHRREAWQSTGPWHFCKSIPSSSPQLGSKVLRAQVNAQRRNP